MALLGISFCSFFFYGLYLEKLGRQDEHQEANAFLKTPCEYVMRLYERIV